ncbi:MAG: TRAP transporter small permease [Firmicutes bacterium]|nr:TRAP transporter small permease [Bacillota bacterium]
MVNLFDRLIRGLANIAFAAMFLVTLLQVIARYVLARPFIWTEEMARSLYVWMTFVGMVVVMKEKEHITVDFLINRVSPPFRHLAALVGETLMLLFAVVLFAGGVNMVINTHRARLPSMPIIRYSLVYLAIPVGAFCLIVCLVRHLASGVNRATSVGRGGEN